MYTICLPCVFVLLYFQLKPASTTTASASAAATSASATCSSATTTASVITSSASAASATATMPSHLSTDLDPADEPVESGSLGEPRVCSTPPPGITLSGTSGRRATRRSASTESELLDKMCEQSDNSAQISDRLVTAPRQGLVTARSTLHHGRGSVQEHLTEITTLRINSYILLRSSFDLRRRSSQKQDVMRTSYQDLPQDEDDGSPW